MAGWPIKKNDSSGDYIIFPIYDADGDLVTGAADLDSEISKDKGTFTDCTNEATELATSSGIYYLDLTQTELNADRIAIITKTSTSGAKTAANVVYTESQQIGDLATSSALSTHDGKLDTVDGIVDNILVDTAEIGTAGAGLTAVPWNAAWDAEVESECTDALNGYDPPTKAEMDSGFAGLNDPTAADVADAVWDEGSTGHTDAGKAGAQMWTDIDAILVDTAEIGAAGAGLTAVPWNAAWDAEVQSECADALTAYAPATSAELSTHDGKLDTVDGIVDAILADTGTDGVVLANDAITAAKIATDAIGSDELAATAANEIADAVLSRDVDQVEATAPTHSLCTAILKAVSKVEDDAGTLKVYQTNGSTLKMSQTITTDSGLDPIDALAVGT